MTIAELLLLAIGLSMDAFAVSICKGLATPKLKLKHMAIVGAWFGGFQALMPTLGYFLGSAFAKYITSVDHWVAFVLLGIIGGNMIKEALSGEDEKADASLGFKTMLLMAVATSIDALAVGITFAFLIKTIGYLIFAVLSIGCTTFLLSAAGVKVGNLFGSKYKSKAEFVGGSILILLGLKILLEGIGIL
ncbi:MAG: manganese efflux pump MntP family protein [Candidatus Ornithomonoglobus sp.]